MSKKTKLIGCTAILVALLAIVARRRAWFISVSTCKLCYYTGTWSWTAEDEYAKLLGKSETADISGTVPARCYKHTCTESRDERDFSRRDSRHHCISERCIIKWRMRWNMNVFSWLKHKLKGTFEVWCMKCRVKCVSKKINDVQSTNSKGQITRISGECLSCGSKTSLITE